MQAIIDSIDRELAAAAEIVADKRAAVEIAEAALSEAMAGMARLEQARKALNGECHEVGRELGSLPRKQRKPGTGKASPTRDRVLAYLRAHGPSGVHAIEDGVGRKLLGSALSSYKRRGLLHCPSYGVYAISSETPAL